MAMDMNAAVKITASVNGGQAIDQLKASMDRLDGSTNSVGRAFGAAKVAVGAFLGLQAVQGVTRFAAATLDAADNLSKMSQRTGIAVDTLGELQYAGDLAGVSIDQIQVAMTKLSVKATDAAKGNKAAKTAFDTLGVSVLDTNGKLKTQIQLFDEAGAAIKNINDPTLKAAMAVEIFGKSGVQLIPLLDTMAEARREARDMGIVFGSDFAQASEQFNDNITRMKSLLSGMTIQILNETIPSINRLMESMIEAGKKDGFFASMGAGIKQLFVNMGTDFKNVDQEIATTEKRLQTLVKMRDDLSKPTIANKINDIVFGDVADLNVQISFATEQLKQLRAEKERLDAAKKPAAAPNGTNPDVVNSEELLDTEKQRIAILQGLADKVLVLKQSEAALTIEKLKRLGASKAEIAEAQQMIDANARLEASSKATKDANEKQAQNERERASTLQGLRDEVLRLKDGETALMVEKMRRLGATDAEIRQLQELRGQREQLNKLDEESKKKKQQELDLMKDLEAQGKRVFEETRTPAEKLAAELERLNKLWKDGAIGVDTYNRAVSKAREEFADVGTTGRSTMDELKSAIEGWGRKSSDALVEFAMTGKTSFGDFANSVIAEILRMITYQLMMKPIFDAIGKAIGGMSLPGWGSSTPGMGYSATGTAYAANGMAFDGVTAFANGGIVNTATPFRFASGGMLRNGIMGEAGPEAIMPLKRGADGKLGVAAAGSSTSVVVNNYSGVSAKAEETMDNRGNRRVEVTIGEMVSNEIRRPGSAAFSSVRETFGARPALVGR